MESTPRVRKMPPAIASVNSDSLGNNASAFAGLEIIVVNHRVAESADTRRLFLDTRRLIHAHG